MPTLPDTPRFTPRQIAHAIDRSERRTCELLRLWRPQHEGQWTLTAKETLSFVGFYVRRQQKKTRS